MSGLRRNWLLFALGSALTFGASSALAQAGAAPAQPASPPAASTPKAAPPAGPAAPIEPVSKPAAAAQPVPALPASEPSSAPRPTAPTAAPAASTAPTAVPAGAATAAQQDEQDQKQDEKPATAPEPPPVPATTATGAGASSASDAEITLGEAPTEASEDDDEELVWSASLEWGQSYNAGSLSRGDELTNNPEYVWDFIATLGYKLDERTALSLRQPLTIELTDSDITNSRQELWVLDTTLDATRQLWLYEPAPKGELALSAGLGLVFPLSPRSQAANMILGTRAKVGVDYTKEDALHGLIVGTGFAYLRRWGSSNVVNTDVAYPCIVGDADIAQSCTYLGGYTTTRDVFKLDVHGELRPLPQLALNAAFSLGFNRAHGLSDFDARTSTGGAVHVEDASTTHWRNTREIVLGVGYDFTDWFSAAANVTNFFYERSYLEDGELRGPFRPVDMAVGLNLAVSIDQLYLAQRGRGAAGD